MNMSTHIVTIERYANNGYGIGFLHKKAVFVPYSAVGDTCAIEIIKDFKDYSFGRIVDIIKPADCRIMPTCPAFARCGGCDYLHLPYEEELSLKKHLLIDTLKRTGNISLHSLPPIETVSAQRYGYRSHAALHSNGQDTGFFEKGSHAVHPLPPQGCLLLHDNINKAIVPGKTAGPMRIAVDKDNAPCSDPNVVFTEMENGITYKRKAGLFFQANRFLRGEMLSIVSTLCDDASSFLDIGCGIGFFSLFLAQRMNGTGIDMHRESIGYAKLNARINELNTIDFHAVSIENYHPHARSYECIIADPPRHGISKRGRTIIGAINPQSVIYVSCNPVTFARDVKSFTDMGYHLRTLYMVDMFPCTHHTEVIGLLTKYDRRTE